jgi:hypothetical protein
MLTTDTLTRQNLQEETRDHHYRCGVPVCLNAVMVSAVRY